jgi:hypothetical protein
MRNKLTDQRVTQRERIAKTIIPTNKSLENVGNVYPKLNDEITLQTSSIIWENISNNISYKGDLLFGYRDLENTDGLYQVILIKNYKNDDQECTSYNFSIVTSKYSMIVSQVDINYLEEIYKELVTFGLDNKFLTIFRDIIENETISN